VEIVMQAMTAIASDAFNSPSVKRMLAIGLTLGVVSAACSAQDTTTRSIEAAKPEFGGQCAESLAEGKHVMTNCSVTWTDKEGKVYCFSSADTKTAFLKSPSERLENARNFVAASGVESTEKAMENFTSTDAETVANTFIATNTRVNGGAFAMEDALTGEKLRLGFDGIDFTRTLDGYGFFPDVKFHDEAHPDKSYLVDFWITPKDGGLAVEETRIYQSPMMVDGKWTATTRQPIPWWWIPASEHPGKMAEKRSWEVMSAVEQNALMESAKHNGVFELTDDKTGQPLKLEFVDTHQPIRKLEGDGQFFACTDFRVAGTKDQIYDIDFWITEKDGKMTVDKTKVHKVPEKKGGQWVQISRYEWKDLGESRVVP
jgi:YHS domain-containing protein